LGFPFGDIAKSTLEHAPQVIWNPALGARFVFYWLMVAFVWSQYRKTAQMQTQLYGRPGRNALVLTVLAVIEGLLVGLVGSYLMTFFGVSFLANDGGIIWVLATAMLLALVNSRLMCFSYAGGLVSLSYLIFGWPRLSVPDLMGLVAILHLMESLLILVSGSLGATPVYLEQKGRQVGAFYLQRAWPVPAVILILALVSPAEATAGISMPEWWPLLRTAPAILAHPGAVFLLHALPAGLGYGDLAITCLPRQKTRRTALNLALYSLALLALCVAATHYKPLVWVAALFAPLAHEAIVRIGNRREMLGQAYFVPPPAGVMVLDVMARSSAAGLGLGPGWIIEKVNGRTVSGRDELEDQLRLAGETGHLTLDARPPCPDQPAITGAGRRARALGSWATRGRRRAEAGPRTLATTFEIGEVFGVIPVPETGDDMGLMMKVASPLLALLRRMGWGGGASTGGK
jgi:hypothetical protein